MQRFIPILLICIATLGTCTAQEVVVPSEPRLTGFLTASSVVNQCQPVRINFVLTNTTIRPILSQRPYAGSMYNIFRTFSDEGFRPLPDRYMVGVSLNGGQDGYPYRFGFRGTLLPGRSTAIVGYLALIEGGTHELTPVLLKGGTVIAGNEIGKALVSVIGCDVLPVIRQPVPATPIYPYVDGRRIWPPFAPYMVNGHLLVAVRPFAYNLGADIYFLGEAVTIIRPGMEIVLYPGTNRAIVNGITIFMPVSTYRIGDIIYVSPRYLSPFLGTTFYWYPLTRQIFFGGLVPN